MISLPSIPATSVLSGSITFKGACYALRAWFTIIPSRMPVAKITVKIGALRFMDRPCSPNGCSIHRESEEAMTGQVEGSQCS